MNCGWCPGTISIGISRYPACTIPEVHVDDRMYFHIAVVGHLTKIRLVARFICGWSRR